MIDIPARADALLAAGQWQHAINLLRSAVARGDTYAMRHEALWMMIGHPLPRDLLGARELLTRAARLGDLEAALTETVLTANGTGAPSDWSRARAMLDSLTQHHPSAFAQGALLAAMDLNELGYPNTRFTSEALEATGRVLRFPKLLTPDECAHIARNSAPMLTPALVVDPRTGSEVPHPIRTSDNMVFGPTREDLVVRALNFRLASISGTQVDQGEALAVLRYAPQQQYRLHLDALSHTRNQRIATVVVYLNDEFSGGETQFPSLGVTAKPLAGDAILFSNTRADGTIDTQMRHAGLPVTKGVKWIATRWIRQRPFDVWSGPEAT